MNSEACLNFGFNSRGSQSQEFVNSGQGATTSPSSSLPGFNNHGALRDTAGLGGNDRSGIKTSMYACPLAGQSLDNFQTMAKKLGLDGNYCLFAMAQAEVFGETNRHLAQATVQGLLLMQVSRLNGKIETLTAKLAQVTHKLQELATPPAPAMPDSHQSNAAASNETTPIREWAPGQFLLDVMNPLALKLLFLPQLTAYTATEKKPKGFLVDSLFNTIKQTISKESPPFAALHLPPQYGGVETSADAQRYASAIRNSGKQAQEKMHNVQLLLGIHDPKTHKDVDIPVPSIKDLVQRVAVKCGTTQNNTAVNVVWNATNLLTQGRISYLAKDEDYETAFYQIIFDEDCQIFDGKAWFKDLKAANINLDLPSEERIRARMPGGADFTGSASNASSQMQPNV
ncbi:hypothetical protein DFH28DRAFT_1136439 [Melampsora americana]|nr:hypothetical protein DFH28DRAFT_1136439 [Melampsora americana]